MIYELATIWCDCKFKITPLFVGHMLREEHPRLKHAMVLIAAHIISDVYLSMIFALEGGLYFIK